MTVSVSFKYDGTEIKTMPWTLCGEMIITVDGRNITKWEETDGGRSKQGVGFRLALEYKHIVEELTEVCRAFPLDQETNLQYYFSEAGETLKIFVEPDGEATIVVELDPSDPSDVKRATTTFSEIANAFVQAYQPLRTEALERGIPQNHNGLSRLEDTKNDLEACLQEKSEVG